MIIVVIPLAVIWSVFRLRRRTRERGTSERFDAVPEAVELVMTVIRSGGSIREALDTLSTLGPRQLEGDVLAVTGRLESGMTFGEAVGGCASDLRPLFEVLSSGERLGVPVEALLFQLAADARSARRRAADEAARRLPVRLSLPLVLCTLPSFVLLVIAPVLIGALQQLRR